MRLSVYIITRDEEENLPACLQSVSWADEIVVVDSGSTDGTVDVAREHGARVVRNAFEGFGSQRNFALELTTCQWVVAMDADERCSEELADEIKDILSGAASADAFIAPRRNYFMGRRIRHGGWYPDYRHPLLFRRHALTYHDDRVHEGYTVKGTLGRLNNDILHYPYGKLAGLQGKIVHYSDLGAVDLVERGRRASRTRAVVNGLWAFVRSYLLRLGFLDGWPGFVIAFSSMESTFYRYAKAAELMKDRKGTGE